MLHQFFKRKNRSGWYLVLRKLHLWLGIGLCVPLVILGLSGSALVFKDEIEGALLQKHNVASGKMHSFSEIIKAAEPVAKEGYRAVMVTPPLNADAPVVVRFSAKGMGNQNVLVDPVSLEILDIDAAPSPFKTIAQLHSNMLVSQYGGRSIVGWLGVVMMFFGISGLVMWWPRTRRWKNSFKVKKGAKGLRLHRDIHGMVGIWGFAVFLAVSFSGVYMAFPKAVKQIFGVDDMHVIGSQKPASSKIINIDEAIALAQNQVKNTHLLKAKLSSSNLPYQIELVPQNYEMETPFISAFISNKGEILDIQNPLNYSKTETFLAWQHALHSGHGFGFLWKILLFTSGFLPILFSVTGISMWGIKRRAKLKTIDY